MEVIAGISWVEAGAEQIQGSRSERGVKQLGYKTQGIQRVVEQTEYRKALT